MKHHREENCWFFGDSAYDGRDYAAHLVFLRAGLRGLWSGEVAVRVDGGETFYVMPEEVFRTVVTRASGLSAQLAMLAAPCTLTTTACHHNEALLEGNVAWESYTFGNLTGAGAMLFAADACADFGALSGKKLANVKLRFGLGERSPTVTVDSWEERA